MDMNTVMPWVVAANSILALATAVYAFLTAGSKKNAEELKAVDTTLDDHGQRIQAIEGELRHLPNKEMVHQIQLTMKDIQIEMTGMKAAAEATTRTTRRMEAFLLKEAAAE